MAEKWFFRVALVGSGRLGGQLAVALEKAGHSVAEIYNPSEASASRLARKLYNSHLVNSLDFSASPCNLFILAVPDAVIAQVASEIVLPDDAVVVHTSGATPMNVLEVTAAEHFGIFWPLQSFSNAREANFQQLPIIIEASDDFALETLNKLASSIGAEPVFMEESERKNLHLAAVFASNFTNHMLRAAEHVLSRDGITIDILQPLVMETMRKAFELGPELAQTGPAAREDYNTIEAQAEMLEGDNSLQRIYRLLSQDIIDRKYEAGE